VAAVIFSPISVDSRQMKKAAEYREHAAQCRALATQMDRAEHREQLLQMAETWDAMAEQRETLLANSDRSFSPPA